MRIVPAIRVPTRRLAFTLIEMLVIISIITLLISMTLPALGKSKENARRAQCMVNTRSQVQACDAYSVNNKDYFPPAQGPNNENAAWSFDIRASFDLAPKRPMGVGLTLAQRLFNHEPKALHCPSMDTSGPNPWGTTYHSMDVNSANWWNSVGASWWNDPVYASKRITIGYTYRSASWFLTNTQNRFIRVGPMKSSFVVNADILDPRFGMRWTHRDGYHFTRMDESTAWRRDAAGTFEAAALVGAVCIDGRAQPAVEEQLWKRLENGN